MSGEKTEQPTPKKLRKAREDGQVAKSPEFSGAVVMVGVIGVVASSMTFMIAALADFIRASILVAFSAPHPSEQLLAGAAILSLCCAPVLITAFVLALAVSYFQVGPGFSIKAIMPDGKRVNPSEGMKRMFSSDRLFDLGKMLSKLTVVGVLAAFVVYRSAGTIVGLSRTEFEPALSHFSDVLFQSVLFVALGLLIIAIADLLWQRHTFMKKMRMSKQEVKDEYKEAEGDPFVKSQRRRLHQQLIRDAGIAYVKTADVVVVNPTHVAAAVRYDESQHEAPIVVASGFGETAERIRAEATKSGVPIMRDVALARSLADIDLLEEIPESLFDAVAEVLRHVYSLQGEQ